MNHNYSVWGTVESIVAAYKIMDENGNIVPDVESQVIVRRMLTALIRFFADNELLKVKPFDADGKLMKEWRGVKVPNHAEDVLEFVKSLP